MHCDPGAPMKLQLSARLRSMSGALPPADAVVDALPASTSVTAKTEIRLKSTSTTDRISDLDLPDLEVACAL